MAGLKNFPVDYAKSATEIFEDVVMLCLKLELNLDILTKFEVQAHADADVPSWAIDWRQEAVWSSS